MRIYKPVYGQDRLPQAMVEAATEFDWAELPERLKASLRNAARELSEWADQQDNPIRGELANELEI